VIKTLTIVILLGALLTGAGLSRPGQVEFERVSSPIQAPPPRNVIERVFQTRKPVDVLQDCDYRNRLLWTDVYLDGQRVATGAFSRWWWTPIGRIKLSPAS